MIHKELNNTSKLSMLLIEFHNRRFRISLFYRDLYDHIEENNASKNLIYQIDYILAKNDLSLQDIATIGFITGPGSFTSSRIVCAACAGIQLSHTHITFLPMRIDQPISMLYPDTPILIGCNMIFYHLFHQNKWSLKTKEEISTMRFDEIIAFDNIDIQIPIKKIDLVECMLRFCKQDNNNIQEINPFYGIEI